MVVEVEVLQLPVSGNDWLLDRVSGVCFGGRVGGDIPVRNLDAYVSQCSLESKSVKIHTCVSFWVFI